MKRSDLVALALAEVRNASYDVPFPSWEETKQMAETHPNGTLLWLRGVSDIHGRWQMADYFIKQTTYGNFSVVRFAIHVEAETFFIPIVNGELWHISRAGFCIDRGVHFQVLRLIKSGELTAALDVLAAAALYDYIPREQRQV